MRSDIRWVGFWQNFPWVLALMFGWFSVLFVSMGVAFTLQQAPQWLLFCVLGLPQLAFGCLVFWVVQRARLLRAHRLASVAKHMRMTVVATPVDDELLPPHDLPLMAQCYGRPRNILSGEFSGVVLLLFDLTAGGSKSTRKQTVAYFPDPLPNLSDFPTGFLGWKIPKAYAHVLRGFGGLTVEARAGRLIIYRRHHLVRPESYPEFLAVARRVYCALVPIAAVRANSA